MQASVQADNGAIHLSVSNGHPTTTSVDIARHFGKQHRDVLRAIDSLVAQLPEGGLRNFAQGSFTLPETGDQQHRQFTITRDGFTLLAMGFTGKKALAFKLAYIDAFNRMEAELLAQTTRPVNPAIDYTRISPAQAQDLKDLVHHIVDKGIQGYAETWARLHRKFRVNSYLELPASRFADARDYLLGKLPEQPATPLQDAQRLQLAYSVATEAAAQVQRSVFAQLVDGASTDLVHARTISAVGFDRHGRPTVALAQALQDNEFITSADALPRMIAAHDIRISDVQASRIVSACAQVLSERAQSRAA